MVAVVIAIAAVKSLGGVIAVPGFFLMSAYGFVRMVRTFQIAIPALMYMASVWVVYVVQAVTNVNADPIRYIQLSLMALFFTAIMTTRWEVVQLTLRICAFLLGLGLVFDFALKPDFRQALARLDLQFFVESGGAAQDSGVQLIAGGNVFAGVLAGAIGIALLLDGSRFLGSAALAIGLFTGSRTLVSALAIVLILTRLPLARLAWRRAVVGTVVGACAALPFLVGGLRALLNEEQNLRLAGYSGRYNAFDTFSRIGFDNPFGVGIFNGKNFEAYFEGTQRAIDGHNVFISTFAEFGWFGYFGLVVLIVGVARVATNSRESAIFFCYLLYAFNFVDGYFEWTFWFGMAVVVHFAQRYGAPDDAADAHDYFDLSHHDHNHLLGPRSPLPERALGGLTP